MTIASHVRRGRIFIPFTADTVTDIQALAVALHFKRNIPTLTLHSLDPASTGTPPSLPLKVETVTGSKICCFNFEAVVRSTRQQTEQRANECRWAHPTFRPSEPTDRGEDRPSRPTSRAIKWDIASQWDKDAECPPSLLLKRRLCWLPAGGRRHWRQDGREGFRPRVSFKPRGNYRKQRRE